MLCDLSGEEGLQELAMVDTPASWLAVLVSAGVHKAGRLAPPSPGAPSPSIEGQWALSIFGPAPKRVHCAPTITTSIAQRGEDNIAGGTPSHGPL